MRVSAERETGVDGSGNKGQSVRIKIEDTGPGIDPSMIENMFEPFSTDKRDGSGLGLAIVKRIVESLGGEVFGYNLEEGGAAISIVLPVSFKGEYVGN